MITLSRIGSRTASLLILASLFAACTPEQNAHVFGGDVAEDWEAAYSKGDADALSAIHTEDALLMPPNAPTVEGRSAIKSYYREHFAARVVPAKTDERELMVFGDITYRQGVYTLDLPDGSTEYGKFVELWKDDNGQWRLHRSIWSSNGAPDPPAGTEPAASAAQAPDAPTAAN